MKTTESQNKKILAYLRRGGKLTALSALKLFGTLRLSGRIYDIKEQIKPEGHRIESKMVTLPDGKRVAQYRLIKEAA